MPRVVCAGHVNWDVTLRVDALPEPDGEAHITRQSQSGGGSASNTAVVLAGLDVATGLLGSVGTDENGWLARRELERAGVDLTLVEATGAATAVKYLVVDERGEVMVLGNEGANEAYDGGDLPEAELSAADRLHLTGQSPTTAASLAERAAAADVPVSFDPGRRLGDRAYEAVIERADLVFLNDREADLLPSDRLAAVPKLVIKHGSGGAELRAEGERTTHPGFAVDPVDTTGAGDAFAAGYLAATVGDEPADPDRALAVGNACGALAARTTGARCSIGWRDVEALLDVGPAE